MIFEIFNYQTFVIFISFAVRDPNSEHKKWDTFKLRVVVKINGGV